MLVATALTVGGIAGFFADSSFARPDDVADAAGLLSVNGWANLVHLLTGAIGLLVAGFAARRYAVWVTAFYAAIALAGAIL